MLSQLQQFVNNLNKTKLYLILGNFLLAVILIILNNFKIIPLRTGDFVFFAVLSLALALYRPGWAFLIFVGMIALENVNLAPESLGIAIRPYQLLGALIILAVAIRFFGKKLYFKLPRFQWQDYALLIVAVSGFLSVANAPDKIVSFKLAIIFATFFALYYLTLIYIQNSEDVKKIVPFFVSSGIVMVIYGIWQNWRFMHNLANFETMAGRPNSVFTEADWLGIYLVLFISVIYVLQYRIYNLQFTIYNQFSISNDQIQNTRYKILDTKYIIPATLYILLILSYILLILTVSRSAWLGAFFTTFIFLWAVFTDFKFHNWQWKKTIQIKLGIIFSLIISIAIVYTFHLTNFQLFNRIQSAGTGMQKITISCPGNRREEILNNELKPGMYYPDFNNFIKYGCLHINLEDIEKEKSAGNFVTEIYRKDPNVQTRSEIYQKSWQQIKNHPILGIGWGSISSVLGKDERGAGLNSSNIFLEVWLGSGIIGFLAFVIFWFYIIFNAVKNFYFSSDDLHKAVNLFIVISWIGLTVANLFNAGIMLGFLWVWMGIALMKNE